MEQEIKKLQEKLAQQQKLASLGLLSAGIAHEIQNPLNFVINFSKMSSHLVDDIEDIVQDLSDKIDPEDCKELQDISADLKENMTKIQEHGQRAISIIQGILLLSRGKEGEKLPTDIPTLLHEYVWLAYHAMRALDKNFNISIRETYPDNMPKVMIVPQDLSRSILNLANNAFYAVNERWKAEGKDFSPEFEILLKYRDNRILITIRDNGCGMSEEIQGKLFHELVTTKPIGKGTGLGMRITHDLITRGLNGTITFQSTVNQGTTFQIDIPCEQC
jgi:signal transduction histidine kinase